MQIGVVGGGPAGLYLALLMKKADPHHEITVVERNPQGATYGWGVVFSDRTLASFREADLPTYEAITERLVIWDSIDVRHRGERVRCGGQVFSGISRRALLSLLHDRCLELGVRLVLEREVRGPDHFHGADLVVGADGVRSVARAAHEAVFRPRLSLGAAKYAWFGTTLPLDAFTFMFKASEFGLFQVHSYPFDGATSTFIVETAEKTWRRAGLDAMEEDESLQFCEVLFAEELRGHRLMSNRSLWLNFVTVRNRTWCHRNLVLVGDAAHTAHFSIGSGTKLAMEDSIALARALEKRTSIAEALAHYEAERRPVVARFQHAAAQSRTYFEQTSRYARLDPHRLAFNLLTRSGRVGYGNIRLGDPRFVTRVDASVSGTPSPRRAAAPSPALAPLGLGGIGLPNRLVVDVGGPDDLARAAGRGAGMVLTRIVAVAEEGRAAPGDPWLGDGVTEAAWTSALAPAGSPRPTAGVRIGHAGPRAQGVDPIGPSAVAHAPWTPVPKEMDESDVASAIESFVGAARVAARAGFEVLVVDMANSHLLASFLSPLTNLRTDRYRAGPALPLAVVDAVRAEWPADRPFGARIAATEWARGGTTPDDAIALARALAARGCALVEVIAGGPHDARPRYDPYYMPSYADRVRNEAGVAVLAHGQIRTVDDAHTLVGSARADLCLLLEDVRG